MSTIEMIAAEIARFESAYAVIDATKDGADVGGQLAKTESEDDEDDLVEKIRRLEKALSCMRPESGRDALILARAHAKRCAIIEQDYLDPKVPAGLEGEIARSAGALRDYLERAGGLGADPLQMTSSYEPPANEVQPTLMRRLAEELSATWRARARAEAEYFALKSEQHEGLDPDARVNKEARDKVGVLEDRVDILEQAIAAARPQSEIDALIAARLMVCETVGTPTPEFVAVTIETSKFLAHGLEDYMKTMLGTLPDDLLAHYRVGRRHGPVEAAAAAAGLH